jgi:hypothetical protein
MKCLFWNLRGIANTSSKLALRRFLNIEKPDLVLIAEPWVLFNSLYNRWLLRLGYKLFALNDRNNLIPNLWCICKVNLDPVVISLSDQYVAFTCSDVDKLFGIVAVYASTCYLRRRQLWSSLSSFCNSQDISWCFMGDFNVILGLHEYRGSNVPASLPMSDFQDWTNANDLLHLPTRGAWFTWSNGRHGRAFTEKRLDRAICNQAWLNSCSMVNCSSLVKNKSGHFPILLNFQFNSISFASQLKFMKMWTLHDTCQDLIANCWRTNIVGSPMFILTRKLKILKEQLKSWNKDVFGNVHSYVKVAEDDLALIQNQIQLNGYSSSVRENEKRAQSKLNDALKRQ